MPEPTRTSPHAPSNLTEEGEFNKYTTSSRAERWLVDNFMQTLESALPTRPVRRVLEVGIGEGHVSERVAAAFPGAELTGIDLPHPTLAERWRDRDVNGVFADATQLPFAAGSFDLVLAIEVLEHLPDPEGALREIARVAARDVVLSVPLEPLWRIGNMVRGRYLADWGNTPDHIQHWSAGAFGRLVGRHLEVRALKRPMPWTLVVAETRGQQP